MFCSKDAEIGSNRLSLSKTSLTKHIFQPNYQTFIWPNHFLPNPNEHGWKIEDNSLILDWEKAASDEVLEFLSCKYQKLCCIVNDCCCTSRGLSCTDFCICKNCENAETCDIEIKDFDDEFDMYEFCVYSII